DQAGGLRRVMAGVPLSLFPGRSAACSEAEWCAADPGSPQARSLRRPRISGAPLLAAPHPGNAALGFLVGLAIVILSLPAAAQDGDIGALSGTLKKIKDSGTITLGYRESSL